MPDKDEFTFFDDKDDPPKSDLRALFSDAEADAGSTAAADVADGELLPESREPEHASSAEAATAKPAGGMPLSRIILLGVLLVVLCAAGIFYFMQLGETPPAPTVDRPKPVKTVAVPPKPVEAERQATAPVPPPPQQSTDAEQKMPEEAKAAGSADAQSSVPAVADKADVRSQVGTAADAAAVANEAEAVTAAPPPAAEPKQTDAASKTVTPDGSGEGGFILDAGSFLLSGNRDRLMGRLRDLEYAPRLSQVEAKVAMTRLRLGVYPQSEASQVLQRAKQVIAGAFSLPVAGGEYAVYAGTFVDPDNIAKVEQRLDREGFRVTREQVEVARKLDRITFGRFATREAAEQEAARLAAAGVEVSVVAGR